MSLVLDEEITSISKNLKTYPIIVQLLSKEWIETKILTKEERDKKHALFWYFVDSLKSESLSNDLSTIRGDAAQTSFIAKIKNTLDFDNFDSLRTELFVYAFYKRKESKDLKINYEPPVPGTTKKNDIELIYRGESHHIEIFNLSYDELDRKNRELQNGMAKKIDSIKNNPFIISFRLRTSFSVEDIEDAVKYLESEIISFKQKADKENEFMFVKNDVDKVEFFLRREPGIDKGFVGAIQSDVREIRNDARIKNWILTKTEQMSIDKKNILVTNLLYPPSRFSCYYDGLVGEEAVLFDRDTHEATPFRHKNGAIYDLRTNVISGFVVFERNIYVGRHKHKNPNSTKQLTDDFFEIL